MKAILEFDLPEESHEMQDAINGYKYSIVIFELDQWLRSKIKYEDLPDKEYDIYDSVREKIRDIVDDYNCQEVWE